MKATTTAHLSEMIIEVLEGGDALTCGGITHKLNLFGIDVKRSAVDREIKKLREAGRIEFQWVLLVRNGLTVKGRVYTTKKRRTREC